MVSQLNIHLAGAPTLPELLRLRVPQTVGGAAHDFGVFLLKDSQGHRVRNIQGKHNGDNEAVVKEILHLWLEGQGKTVTWRSLIDTLTDLNLTVLAREIETYAD